MDLHSQEIPQKKNNLQNQPKTKKMSIETYTSIIKCKWIKCSNQKTQLAEWIQKQYPYICCLQETCFRPQDTYRLKVKGWKKYILCKWEAKGSWSSNPHIRQNRP